MHVCWQNGSSLGLAFGEDVCRIVKNSK
ncbi:DUF4314 domain-containing protein [Succinimonas amylolytica]|nr:DUF4314 domain-containing protein [Succinimonas amylolytica]